MLDNISKEYFDNLKEVTEKSAAFINDLKKNDSFKNYLLQQNGLVKLSPENPDRLIEFLFLIDTGRCFRLVSDITTFETKESFSLLFLLAMLLGLKVDDYEQLQSLIKSKDNDFFDPHKRVLVNLNTEIKKSELDDHDFLILAYLLQYFDPNIRQVYLRNLYQFISLIIKADGTVSLYEEYVLKNIINRKYEDRPRQIQTDHKLADDSITIKPIKRNDEAGTLESVLKELDDLTGLANVKKEIKTLTNFIKIQKEREKLGLKTASISYHLVFTGNPGTGKTTVARIITKIYKSLGLVALGHLIETDRSGLVAEYLGQTAVKANKTIDSALNGILFIDEAYSLVGKNEDSYGEEAIATLIKRMEDDRNKLVVIAAGYTNEMKSFIDSAVSAFSQNSNFVCERDFKKLTAQIASVSFLGRDLDLLQSLEVWVAGFFAPLPLDLPWTTFGAGLQQKKQIKNKILAEIRKTPQLYAKYEMREEDLAEELQHLMFASYNTTAVALTNCMVLLSMRPDVKNRLRGAITADDSKLTENPLGCSDLNGFIFFILTQIPSVIGIFRETKRNCQLENYEIPRGWKVVLQPSHETLLTDDRFILKNKTPIEEIFSSLRNRKSDSFYPFGAGARTCLGKNVALNELALVLISFLKK